MFPATARLYPKVAALVPLLAMLAACGNPETGARRVNPDFIGGAVSEEPRSALIAREVLAGGGSAVDAVVAGYFAMAVTLPSSVGLGGGGSCAVYDRDKRTGEIIEFPALAASSAPNAVAIPAAPRGLYALHARYGVTPFTNLMIPAERLARFGEPVSRKLANDIAFASRVLPQIPDTREMFTQNGRLAVERDMLTQFDLAATLGRLRSVGIGDLYNGQMARDLSRMIEASGGALPYEALRDYVPTWRPSPGLKAGNNTLVMASTDTVSAAYAESVWRMLTEVRAYDSASAEEQPHLLAEASMRAHAAIAALIRDSGTVRALTLAEARAAMAGYDPSRHQPAGAPPLSAPAEGGPGAASILAYDSAGQLVSCAFTMNAPFGTLRKAPGLGFLVAPPPAPPGRSAPVGHGIVMFNENSRNGYYLAAGSGGFPASLAILRGTLDVLDGMDVDQAISRPRQHVGGAPDAVWVEPGMPEAVTQSLTRRGYNVDQGRHFGRVQAVHCPVGLPNDYSCTRVPDPRGNGLAVSGD